MPINILSEDSLNQEVELVPDREIGAQSLYFLKVQTTRDVPIKATGTVARKLPD